MEVYGSLNKWWQKFFGGLSYFFIVNWYKQRVPDLTFLFKNCVVVCHAGGFGIMGVWWPGPILQAAIHWVCIQIHAYSKGRQEGEHRGRGPREGLISYWRSEQCDQSLSRLPFRPSGYFKPSEFITEWVILSKKVFFLSILFTRKLVIFKPYITYNAFTVV